MGTSRPSAATLVDASKHRYHALWRAWRDEQKFRRLSTFGRALPAIRRRVDRDLRRSDLTHEQVIATVVRLLETTALREELALVGLLDDLAGRPSSRTPIHRPTAGRTRPGAASPA